jgi:hypothetical protein
MTDALKFPSVGVSTTSTNWLDNFLEARQNFESPRKFFYWSALAAISAVVKRNVYLRKKDAETRRTNYILYPNIYVFLVGDSAVVRKGPPIKAARKLVKAVNNTRIISGRASIQGILKELATAYSREDGPPITDAAAFICASEFRSSLISDPQALSILTDIYDGDFSNDWKTLLKGSDIEELKDVYPVILGGSNPAYLKEAITGADIEGGFVGRSFMVYGSQRQKINALVADIEGDDDGDDDEGEDEQYQAEAEWLKELTKLKGHFKYTREGARIYKDWYENFTTKEVDDKTGTFGRLHDQVLKVAMLLSLSRKTALVLDKSDVQDAIDSCIELAGDVNKALMPSGKSEFAAKTTVFLQEMLRSERYEISRRKFLQKHWGDVDAFDLDRIVETMINAQWLNVRKDGKDTFYQLTDVAAEQYLHISQKREHTRYE